MEVTEPLTEDVVGPMTAVPAVIEPVAASLTIMTELDETDWT